MAEFKLGRIKFVYQGTWQTGQSYVVDDVVTVSGKTYICVISHNSSAAFTTDLSANPSKWNLMADGLAWRGTWTATTYYNKGDLVKYGGIVYQCNTAHTSATFTGPTYLGLENDQSKWDVFSTAFNWTGAWATGTRYKKNDFVTYGGYTYICNTAHISDASSSNGLEVDQAKWDTFNAGVIYQGAWAGTTRYKLNDVVKYGADLWICTTQHTSSGTFDNTKFSMFVNGLQFENSWVGGTTYQIGDVVTYGGYSYICKQNHSTSQTPSAVSSAYWDVYTTGFSFQGDWNSGTSYKVGHVVRLGGYTYVATVDSLNQTPPNTSYWARLNSGLRWAATSGSYTGLSATNISSSGSSAVFTVTRAGTVYSATATTPGSGYAINDTLKILGTSLGGLSPVNDVILTVTGVTSGGITAVSCTGISTTWTSGTTYVLGDVTFWGSSSYICVSAHVAATGNRPDNDTTATYWNLLANGTETAVLTTKGDMFYYGPNGATRLPVGTDGQVLRVNSNSYPAWAYYGQINNLVWVAPSGVDTLDDGTGTTIDKPWKSVRYAAQKIEEGYLNRQAGLLLAKNKQFVLKEIDNFVQYTYKATITSTNASNQFVAADTGGLRVNMPVVFTTTIGGVTVGTQYYIKTIDSSTLFTISNTRGGSTRTLTQQTGAQTVSYNNVSAKTQRDTGYVLDGIIFDITHSGTSKTIANASAYYTSAGTAYATNVDAGEITVFTETHEYLKTLVANILGNVPPANNYQTLNGISVGSQALQIIDNTLTAETGTTQSAQDLIQVIKAGVSAGTATGIPTPIQPTTTIRITTGTFNEVTPINIPSYTAIVGDELRTSVVQPASANKFLVNDETRSTAAIQRLRAIVPNLMSNTPVTPTTGNTVSQVTSLPAGSVGSTLATSRITKLADTVYDVFTNGINSLPDFQIPDPTNYGTSLTDTAYAATGYASGATTGFDLGRAQIIQNYAFLKADVSQYLINNYNSVWTALGATGQAKCQRDVGYILDAIVYDITYGGNTQSLIAGSSYYSYYQLTIANSELTATKAAYAYLKAQVSAIVTKTAVAAAGNVTPIVTTGTAGSAAAAAFAGDRVQNVYDWLNNGTAPATVQPATSWVSASLVAARAALQARRSEIAADASAWVKKFFQNVNFVEATCQRDVGLMVDAFGYDLMFNSNYASIVAGMSYSRSLTSTAKVTGSQFQAQQGFIEFLKSKCRIIAASGSAAQVDACLYDLISTINNGGVPRFQWPDPSTINSGYAAAKMALYDNVEFLQAEVIAYIAANYPAVSYDSNICKRDVRYVIDALRYDLTYGGNFASTQAGKKYYSALTSTLQIASGEKAATLAAYGYLSTLAQSVAQNTLVASPLQGSVTQVRTKGTQTVGSAGAATQIGTLMTTITNIINNGLTTGVPTLTITAIASGNTFTSNGHGLAVGDMITAQTTTNGLIAGTIYYVQSFATNTFTLSSSYLGAALSGFTNGTGLTITVEKTNMPSITGVSTELQTAYQTLSGAKAAIQAAVLSFINTNYSTLTYNQATCSRDVGFIIDSIAYDFMFNSNFRSVVSGRTYYTSQASLVIAGQKEATISAMNYLKTQIAASVYSSTTAQTRANNLMDIIIKILTTGIGTAATAELSPEINGTVTYENTLATIQGAEILRANSDFIAAELAAFTTVNNSATVTNTTVSTNVITTSTAHNLVVGDPVQFSAVTINATATQTFASTDGVRPNQILVTSTAGMVVNMPIIFTGTVFGGITQNSTYYIKSLPGGNYITISSVSGGTTTNLTAGTGSTAFTAGGLFGNLVANTVYWVLTTPSTTTFTVTATNGSSQPFSLTTASGVATSFYYFDQAKCKRDTAEYVKALVYDLQYTGNYKTLQAAMWYNNSVTGSTAQDMFRVRNATGLRNCTLNGLYGPYGGLTNANSYGTKRPTAGAFVALDPGFGPNDTNVWVTNRSHYSQNVTMFGTGCTGAKIDAALHNGGNKSMVKNDFTTILSDGIGVWCTGSGSLTELVSVFNYYGYAGYLAEYGGRIRATNGNSSYGTYGVIAEGVDTYETPLYGTVNNSYFQAQMTNVVTDLNNKVLRIEYGNAGQNYTNSVTTISGSGFNAAAMHDEFRDGALFESRIIDLNDGNGYGGTSYVTFANAAQTGDRYSITIAATDTSLSSAYIGMRIQVTAGTGVGQYGNILTYNNGSKIAQVYKDSFNNVTITATTQGTPSTVTVSDTSQMYATMPFYVASTVGGLSSGQVYFVQSVVNSTTINVSATSGGGALTSAITTTTGQSVTLYAAGWDHTVSGTPIVAALDLTTTYIIEPRISYTAPGYAATARTLPATATWSNMAYGSGNYVAIASGGTSTAYSTDGVTWSAGGALPSSQTWGQVVYAGGEGATATATLGGFGGSGAVLSVQLGTAGNVIAGADQVLSVTVVQGGTGYTSPPTILFSGGSGSGTQATAVLLNGTIVSVTVTVPGSGYTSAPTATAYTGTVTGYTMVSYGKNYFSTPTVTVSDPFNGSAWTSGGSAVLNTIYYFNNSGIKNFYTCTGAGTFTTSGPIHQSGAASNGTATLTYIGTTATAAAVTNSGTNPNLPGVTSITFGTNGTGGYGYTSVPTVTITDATARFVAISTASTNSAYAVPSNLGAAWAGGGALPSTSTAGLTYGGGILVTCGRTALASTSSDGGATWVSRTLPTLGAGTYVSVHYGNAIFLALGSQGQTATSSNGVSWTAQGTIPGSITNWASMAYGNGRFVAIAGGQGGSANRNVAYTIDNGVTWYLSPNGMPASAVWTRIRYGAGLFFATAEGTNQCATSPDGITWTLRTLPSSSNWVSCAFGNTNKRPLWAAISRTSGTVAASIRTGAQATGRVKVVSGVVTEVRMLEPGSGYPYGTISATAATTNVITADNVALLVDSQPIEFTGVSTGGLTENVTYYVIGSTISGNTFKVSATQGSATPVTLTAATGLTGTYRAGPIYTLTDPNKVKTAALRMRMADGSLGNPSFTNRGTNNTTATAVALGDGFSDLYQPSTFINVAGLYQIPKAGANVEFANIPNTWYKLVSVTNVLGIAGNYTAQLQINPSLTVYNAPSQGTLITTRLLYSQVRLTGHDFLYIGTGNKQRTNYPYVDTTLAVQANQSNSSGGGRVFFTSTDQDGNFNVGNLFGVQQATGTATLNASAFNLSGLQSLQLGAVSIGVGSAVITQFSTDPYFTANSDSIVPTQRAIKAYITAQIGGGASSLNVNTLTAGVVYLANNTISTTTGVQINVTAKLNFTGGIDGAPVALGFFMQR